MPDESTVPHALPVHPAPEAAQVTARFGFPEEFTEAAISRDAPNSSDVVCGASETVMSLVMVTVAEEFLEVSAALVAVTETDAGAGRIAGAV